MPDRPGGGHVRKTAPVSSPGEPVFGAMNRCLPLKRAMMLNAGALLGDVPRLLRGEAL